MGCIGSILGMVIWAGICAIIGGIVAGITDIGLLFWVISIVLFIIGLPGMLIGGLIDGFIQDKIDYVQDREDYRQLMHDISEDERMDRYLDKIDDYGNSNIFIDNRQIHFHNYSENGKKTKRIKKTGDH